MFLALNEILKYLKHFILKLTWGHVYLIMYSTHYYIMHTLYHYTNIMYKYFPYISQVFAGACVTGSVPSRTCLKTAHCCGWGSQCGVEAECGAVRLVFYVDEGWRTASLHRINLP